MSVVHGVFSLYVRNSPSVVVYSTFHPPGVILSASLTLSIKQLKRSGESTQSYLTPLSTSSSSGLFSGLDLAPCVGVHFPADEVNEVTGHLVVPQDGNEYIAIHRVVGLCEVYGAQVCRFAVLSCSFDDLSCYSDLISS